MIKFFRHIRRSLIQKNQMGKYFKYAIGEIILVVIGILIALQINNWNEKRKENLFEKKVLSEILMGTEEDLKEMKYALDSLNDSQKSSHALLSHLNDRKPYHDSLDVDFAKQFQLWSLSPNTTAFEMAKTEGLHIIKNDSIRLLTAKVNEYTFDYIRVLESRFQDYKTNIVLSYTLPLFDSYNFEKMKPRNYETLTEDATYLGIIKTLSLMRKRYLENIKFRYDLLKKLNEMIKTELE